MPRARLLQGPPRNATGTCGSVFECRQHGVIVTSTKSQQVSLVQCLVGQRQLSLYLMIAAVSYDRTSGSDNAILDDNSCSVKF